MDQLKSSSCLIAFEVRAADGTLLPINLKVTKTVQCALKVEAVEDLTYLQTNTNFARAYHDKSAIKQRTDTQEKIRIKVDENTGVATPEQIADSLVQYTAFFGLFLTPQHIAQLEDAGIEAKDVFKEIVVEEDKD